MLKLAAGSLALRGFVLVAGFSCQLLLARLLTLPEYGSYVFALAWVRVLGVPATLGLERLIVRDVAALKAAGDWGGWRGLIGWSQRLLLAVSLGIAVAIAVAAWLLFPDRAWAPTMALAALLLPLLTMTRVRQFVVQGMGHPILSQLAEALILPTVFAGLLIGWHLSAGHLSAERAVGANIAATAVALAAASLVLARALPGEVRHAAPTSRWRHWSRSIGPLLLTTSAAALTAQLPTLLLGLLTDRSRYVALFAVARTLSELAFIPVLALVPIWSPQVASAWARGRRDAVQRMATTWARWIAYLYLPIFIVLMAFAEPILALFGPAFEGAATALRILCVGQLVNILAGHSGIVLVMTGHEREMALVGVASAVLCALLCAVFIPSATLEGAAIAAAATMIATNVAGAWSGWTRLGLMPTVFAAVPVEQPGDEGPPRQQA